MNIAAILSIYVGIALGLFLVNGFQGHTDLRVKVTIVAICLFWPVAIITLGLVWVACYLERDNSL